MRRKCFLKSEFQFHIKTIIQNVKSVDNIYFSCTFYQQKYVLRGYCTSYQKLACFVLYLKIINTFLKNNICILEKIVQGIQKCIDILEGQAVFQL